MDRKLRIVAHVLLFVIAVIAFYLGLGLGLGLQYSPTIGSVLWIVSAAIVTLNLMWIVRSRGRRPDGLSDSH